MVGQILSPAFLRRFEHAAYLRFMRNAPASPLECDPAKVNIPWYARATESIATTLYLSSDQFVAHLARIRCTEAGLAVLGYREGHGTWPDSLAACMATVPIDPFDGKHLRYRLTEKGFVVSSVGTTGRMKSEIAWRFEPTR